MVISKDKCGACAHYIPQTIGCHRAAAGLKCVLDVETARQDLKIAESKTVKAAPSALDRQVGGGHYKDFEIQPAEFITRNNISFLEGCVIKRMCRHSAKAGREDLEKAKHEIDLLIELKYGGKP